MNTKTTHSDQLIEYIQQCTGLSQGIIKEIISSYVICVEEDINIDSKYYYESIQLMTGIKYKTIENVMNHMTQYIGSLL